MLRKATVQFEITLKYTTEIEEYEADEEDFYTLEQEITKQKEYLETQREDLADALSNSELQEVKILKITEG